MDEYQDVYRHLFSFSGCGGWRKRGKVSWCVRWMVVGMALEAVRKRALWGRRGYMEDRRRMGMRPYLKE